MVKKNKYIHEEVVVVERHKQEKRFLSQIKEHMDWICVFLVAGAFLGCFMSYSNYTKYVDAHSMKVDYNQDARTRKMSNKEIISDSTFEDISQMAAIMDNYLIHDNLPSVFARNHVDVDINSEKILDKKDYVIRHHPSFLISDVNVPSNMPLSVAEVDQLSDNQVEKILIDCASMPSAHPIQFTFNIYRFTNSQRLKLIIKRINTNKSLGTKINYCNIKT